MGNEIRPAVACARPRVSVASRSGEPVLLEEWVAERLTEGRFGVVHLVGPPGSGKSTALGHLAARFDGCSELALFDEEPPPGDLAGDRLVLVAYPGDGEGVLVMAPWSRDDLIEYVLAAHDELAASILARAGSGSSGPLPLRGRPAVWVAVIEELARDADLPDLPAALDRLIDADLSRTEACALGRRLLLAVGARTPQSAWPLMAFEEVHAALMWRALLREIEITGRSVHREIPLWLEHPPLTVYPGAGRHLPEGCDARRVLEEMVKSREGEYAGAAALLNAVDHEAVRPLLAAREWPARLSRAHLPGVNLADLDEPIFASEANLAGANLTASVIARALRGFLDHADLSRVRAHAADFAAASLRRADLTAGRFERAKLESADLRGARLDWAAFTGAVFTHARLGGASLHWADLSHAQLDGVDLRGCRGETATFHCADLEDANLEGLCFWAPDFSEATLSRALLTDTRFQQADLRGASLVEAGLGGVSWPLADLRDADLTGATFHFGSSRSGLLFAGTSEGTRTGFYTEEMRDLAHKDPADVRVADLRGVDLRGARTDDTDWYRVDLRGARFDAAQRRHMSACGAILGRV